MMARYQIILSYDGTHFLGSQRQDQSRTVQGELEKALQALGWQQSSVILAGRTDSGTHASGQVAAFDLEWKYGCSRLIKALNGHLPRDMSVRQARQVAIDFHPRFDATSRRYRYQLFCAEIRDPLRERFAWRVWPAVTGLETMAPLWPGTHDFAAFGSPMHAKGSTIRRVLSAAWQEDQAGWSFEIEADAFLYRMVRRIVFLQVAVSHGKVSLDTVKQALKYRASDLKVHEKLPAGLAPACGLNLKEVCYDNLEE
jgi:tRNA pseudouridine38-40 synthase